MTSMSVHRTMGAASILRVSTQSAVIGVGTATLAIHVKGINASLSIAV
jgi:hypothetical protein